MSEISGSLVIGSYSFAVLGFVVPSGWIGASASALAEHGSTSNLDEIIAVHLDWERQVIIRRNMI
jgi:hypothetical protein